MTWKANLKTHQTKVALAYLFVVPLKCFIRNQLLLVHPGSILEDSTLEGFMVVMFLLRVKITCNTQIIPFFTTCFNYGLKMR